jgi:hypothetical protein
MKALAVFTLIVSIGCLSAASGVYVVLKGEMEDLEENLQLRQTEKGAGEDMEPIGEVPEWVPLIEARIATLEEKIESLGSGRGNETSGTRTFVSSPGGLPIAPGVIPNGAGAEVAREPGKGPESREDLESKVKDLESKLGEVQERLDQGGKGEEKPKFSQFAARLDLDEGQKTATSVILKQGKKELLEHLLKPLPDGTVLVDQFGEMLYKSSVDPKAAEKEGGRIFMRLFSEKVPGTEQTFIEVIGDLNGRLKTDMEAHLNEEQKKKFDEWAPDPTDIELRDDPINSYLMKYMEKRKMEEEGR